MSYTLESSNNTLTITFDSATIALELDKIIAKHISGSSVYLVFSYREDTSNKFGTNTVKLNYADCTSTTFASVDELLTYISDLQELAVTGANNIGADPSTNSIMTSDITPEWSHYTDVEHPVSLTNTAAGTYELSINMDGYRSAAIQLHSVSTGTVTFKAFMTLDEDAADDDFTDTSWVDATTDLFGAATITNADVSAIAFIETLRMPKKIGIQYVTSSAVNTVDIWVRKY